MVTPRFSVNEAIIILGLMVSIEFKDLYAFGLSSIPAPLIAVLFRAFSAQLASSTHFFYFIMFNTNVIMEYTVFLDTNNIDGVLFS